MKLLTISDMYPKNEGSTSGTFVRAQIKALAKQGVESFVLCPVPRLSNSKNLTDILTTLNRNVNHRTMDSIPICDAQYWNIPLKLSVDFVVQSMYKTLYARTMEIYKDFKFDLIHAHRMFPIGYVSMLIANKMSIPFAVTAHGSDIHTNPHNNPGIKKYTIKTIQESDTIIAVSENLKNQIEELAQPKNNIYTVYNGVNPDEFTKTIHKLELRIQLDLPQDGVGICTVSRLVKEKGLIELILAFKSISKNHPNCWLTIIGEGPLNEEIQQLIQTENLGDQIFLAGPKPHSEVNQWLSAADIFTLPSYNEGFPVVILEAMSCGLPVVATNVGGIAELITSHQNGILIEPRNIDTLQTALTQLITNGKLRTSLAESGQQLVSQKYQWSDCTRQLKQIYLASQTDK